MFFLYFLFSSSYTLSEHNQQNEEQLLFMIPWASYQIRKIASCACAGNAGNVSPCGPLQRKPLVSDPGMHHGTCMMHVPWCMSGSLTRGGGENVPGIPGACAPAILRIWQEAHWLIFVHLVTGAFLVIHQYCNVCTKFYHVTCLPHVTMDDCLYTGRDTYQWLCIVCSKPEFPFNHHDGEIDFLNVLSELWFT